MTDRRVMTTAALALLLGCGGSSSEGSKAEYGNPEGYTVHVLTGASLSARDVTVNDLQIDPTSVETIDASVQALLDETVAPRTVEELPAGAADVTVDFTGAATSVPPTFFGADIQWRSKFFLGDARWRALARHMKLQLLRFPGGQERVRYDGKDSTSGTPASDTLTVGADQPYQFRLSGADVAAFIDLCRELGAQAEPEVNVYDDDPQMAADLVRQIVDDLGYDLRYVSVGNEPDIDTNQNWTYLGATGTTDDARRASALANYAARYLAYRARIDPLQAGLTYALAELGDSSRLDGILSAIGADQPGALSAHWYLLGDWGQDPSWSSYPSIDHLVTDNADHTGIWRLRDMAAAMRARAAAHGLDAPELFVGEFATSWSATAADAKVSDRLAAALFVAEALETGKAAGLASMQYFGLSDPASFAPWVTSLIVVDEATGAPRPRAAYYVYLLYKHLYGDETVAVPGGQDADASIYASRGGGKDHLLLINRTADRTLQRVARVKTSAGEKLLRLTLRPHSIAVVSF
jgi:hypothetical protein